MVHAVRAKSVNVSKQRDEIRASMIAWRTRLTPEDLSRRAASLVEAIEPWIVARGARVIGTYSAIGGELDPGPLPGRAELASVQFAYPVLDGKILRFGVVGPETVWAPNQFGINEPQASTLLDAADLDLVLVPCVAVDRSGNRLGFGAGWYDRTFAAASTVERVGLVHPEQIVEQLEPARWDIALTALATPTEVVSVSDR